MIPRGVVSSIKKYFFHFSTSLRTHYTSFLRNFKYIVCYVLS